MRCCQRSNLEKKSCKIVIELLNFLNSTMISNLNPMLLLNLVNCKRTVIFSSFLPQRICLLYFMHFKTKTISYCYTHSSTQNEILVFTFLLISLMTLPLGLWKKNTNCPNKLWFLAKLKPIKRLHIVNTAIIGQARR